MTGSLDSFRNLLCLRRKIFGESIMIKQYRSFVTVFLLLNFFSLTAKCEKRIQNLLENEKKKKFVRKDTQEKVSDIQNKKDLQDSKPFYVLTIPKAGTFLLAKMLGMLTGKNGKAVWTSIKDPRVWKFASKQDPDSLIAEDELERIFLNNTKTNYYPFAHLNFSENFQEFSLNHPEYEKIVMIRDLKDVCISFVYYLSEQIEEVIHSSSFDDKLMFVIEGRNLSEKRGTFAFFWNLEKLAKIAIEWIGDPTVTVCRFEDLIGEKGGGTLEAQQNQIIQIANILNISLTTKKIDRITSQLFGVRKGPQIGLTYREGQIGSWKMHFKDEHKEAFNRILGPLQKELGYSLF